MIAPLNFNNISTNYTREIKNESCSPKFVGRAKTSDSNLKYLNAYYPPEINFKVGYEQAQIKELLDNKVYEFKTPNGEGKFSGTIKEFIQECIISVDENRYAERLLHGTSSENRENILENGFDPKKVSRTICGPGISCTGSEYEAINIGGGSVLKFKFYGTTANTEHKFFEEILYNTEIIEDIDKLTGSELERTRETQKMFTQEYYGIRQGIEKKLCDYTRNLLVNDLGIDSGYDHGSRCIPPCFVIYNTDKIYDIKPYN